jgi:transcription-repair coupling factor (superfamily II helicase)
MLIWRPDRFGLAQLHQLRGRVGRGSRRGIVYLVTDPAGEVGSGASKRLQTLQALQSLGAGFAISQRDMDLRGAGDLLGDQQAGHVKLIGIELYQHLLERALTQAGGETPPPDWTPQLQLDFGGAIPADYVPAPELRMDLYLRLARIREDRDLDAFADELADRFGAPPEAVLRLLEIARVRQACHHLGIARIDAGPQAVALTFRPEAKVRDGFERTGELAESCSWKDGRLICRRDGVQEQGPDQLIGILEEIGRR